MEKCYLLLIEEGKRIKYAYGISINISAFRKEQCAACGTERNIRIFQDPPEKVVLSNSHFPDFLGYYATPPFKLWSEKAKDTIESENITGIEFEPVNVVSAESLSKETKRRLRAEGDPVSKFAVDPPNYFYGKVTGHAELHEKTKKHYQICTVCGHVKSDPINPADSGLPKYLQKGSWDGQDLFVTPYFPARIFCSQRFFEVCREYNLTGYSFTGVESME